MNDVGVGKYDVVVADPPWAYGASKRGSPEWHYATIGRRGGSAEALYPTIGAGNREIHRLTGAGVENIVAAVDVAALAKPNAHLYLWTTAPKLPFAFAVLSGWGFVYKTTLTWVKADADGNPIRHGLGWFFRGCAEFVLFGVRGNLPIPAEVREPNVLIARRGEHSEKPDRFYELVDRVSPPNSAKIDLFARRRRPGWDAWGLEAADDLVSAME